MVFRIGFVLLWFLATLLVAPIEGKAAGDPHVDGSGNRATAVSLSRVTKNKDGSLKEDVMLSEQVTMNVTFTTSASTAPAAYSIRVVLPDEFFSKTDTFKGLKRYTSVPLPAAASRVRFEVEGDDTVIYIDYDELGAGYFATIPVTFQLSPPASTVNTTETPLGTRFPVNASVIRNGLTVSTADPLEYALTYGNRRMTTLVESGEYTSSKNEYQVTNALIDDSGAVVHGSTSDIVVVNLMETSSTSVRSADGFTIRFTPEQGAVMDTDLVIGGVRVNEGWVPSAIPGMYERYVSDWSYGSDAVRVYLRYPSAMLDVPYTQRFSATIHVKNPGAGEVLPSDVQGSVTVRFRTKPSDGIYGFRTAYPASFMDTKLDKSFGGLNFIQSLNNPLAMTTLRNVSFTGSPTADTDGLDGRLRFMCVNIPKAYVDRVTQFTIHHKDGTSYNPSYAEMSRSSSWAGIPCQGYMTGTGNNGHLNNSPKSIVGYDVTFSHIDPGETISLNHRVAALDPDGLKYDPSDSAMKTINRFHFEGGATFNVGASPERFLATGSSYGVIRPYNKTFSLSAYFGDYPSSAGGDSDNAIVGTRLVLGVSFRGMHEETESTDGSTFLVILPDGLSLVPDHVDDFGFDLPTVRSEQRQGRDFPLVDDVQVLPDFNGTGRVGLLMKTAPQVKTSYTDEDSAGGFIEIQTVVTRASEPGENKAEVYFGSDIFHNLYSYPANAWQPSSYFVPDSFNLSERGGYAMYNTATYNYTPVQELISELSIRTTPGDTWTRSLKKVKPGDTIEFRARVRNLQPVPVMKLYAHSFFPSSSNDKYGTNDPDTGTRLLRGSTVDARLVERVDLPAGFDDLYMDSGLTSFPASLGSTWFTRRTPADVQSLYGGNYGAMRSFGAVAQTGRTVAPGETVDFYYKVRFPTGTRIGDRAVTTFSATGGDYTQNNAWFESNAVTALYDFDVDVGVTVTWGGDPAPSADIALLRDGAEVATNTTTAPGWAHVFMNQPGGANGNLHAYTVKPQSIKGYKTTVSGDASTGFIVHYEPSTGVDIDVRKVWVGDKQTHVTVDLLADGTVVDTVRLDDSNGWTHTFVGVDETDASGDPIHYTVAEHPDHSFDYYDTVTGDADSGFVITNSQKPVVSLDRIYIPAADAASGFRADASLSTYAAKPELFDDLDATDTFRIRAEFRDKNGNVSVSRTVPYEARDVMAGDIPVWFGSGGRLLDDKTYDVTFTLETTSRKIATTSGLGVVPAHTLSKRSLVMDARDSATLVNDASVSMSTTPSPGLVYTDAIATEKVRGTPVRTYYEQLTVNQPGDPNPVAGYGTDVSVSVTHRVDRMGSVILSPGLSTSNGFLFGVDEKLVETDALASYTVAPGGMRETSLFETDKRSTWTSTQRESIQSYRLPNVYVSRGTGRIDLTSRPDAVDGGRHFYTPVWLDALGSYEMSVRSKAPMGVNRVTVTIRRDFKVDRYMYNHIGSQSFDKDVFSIQPLTIPFSEPRRSEQSD